MSKRVFAALFLSIAGIVGTAIPALAVAQSAAPPASASDVYRLGPGDKLRITVFNEPALTGEYNITAAGSVAFPLIGDVVAVGHTSEDLASAIVSRLSPNYVKDARVSVEILNYRPYYILGEVLKPGEYPYSVGLDLVQAVATAGGYTYRANRKTIYLRHRGESAERKVNLHATTPLVLPGDTIRIGERYF